MIKKTLLVTKSRVAATLLALCMLLPAMGVPAFAQSTAQEVITGYLSTSGCKSGLTVCFIQNGSGGVGPGSNVTIISPAVALDASLTGIQQTNSGTKGNSVFVIDPATGNPLSYTLPTVVKGNGTAGTPDTAPVTIQGITGGTNVPTAEAPATITTSSALAANQIVVAAAGKLVSFEVSADSTLSAAAWWIMIYDAIAAPSDGAVTPKKCYALPSGSTGFTGAFNVPVTFSTGITIGVSTTGCFTKTASTHAFISGDYR